ncbi:taste receptor type 2 member 7-like [Anolis carolinensis]|uniref:taste receptor type 2 member 7-like n=1 Tax=Anolis carolinensis TaxID=28377 RepID=UPI002F2B6C82
MVNNMSTVKIFFLIIFEIVSFIGILGNGFIIVVNGHKWFQSRKMIPSDFLLTSLSTSRFIMQLSLLINYVLLFSLKNNFRFAVEDVMFFSWMFSNMISHWCATGLCVFYCVKVANFANPLFLWLKARINMHLPRLLGLSIAIFMVSCLPFLFEYFGHRKWCNLTEILPENASQSEFGDTPAIVFLPMQFSFYVINLCLSTIASILLLVSLWRHTRNLKKSGVGVKDLSTQVHIKVMAFLLFWIFFYFADLIALIIYADLINSIGTVQGLLLGISMSAFPSAHSIILILTNPKLKEMFDYIIKNICSYHRHQEQNMEKGHSLQDRKRHSLPI